MTTSPRRARGSVDCAGPCGRSRSVASRRRRSGSRARRRPSRSPRAALRSRGGCAPPRPRPRAPRRSPPASRNAGSRPPTRGRGRAPARRRRRGRTSALKVRSRTSTPAIETEPRSTSYRRAARYASVVLPEPVSPTSAVVVPSSTRNPTSDSVHPGPPRAARSSGRAPAAWPPALPASAPYRNQTWSNSTSPASTRSIASGFSKMSTGWSRYSKIRSNSASDVWTSRLTPSSEPTGKNRRVCSVVNATRVATEIEFEPWASARPPNQ